MIRKAWFNEISLINSGKEVNNDSAPSFDRAYFVFIPSYIERLEIDKQFEIDKQKSMINDNFMNFVISICYVNKHFQNIKSLQKTISLLMWVLEQ